MAAAGPNGFDTSGVSGPIWDAQYDGTGARLATAHGNGVVRIWGAERHEVQAELRGHGNSPVWTLSWAAVGSAPTLASGSVDGTVIISREVRPGEWHAVHRQNITGSVSTVAFGGGQQPTELAVAGTDELGVVSVVTRRARGTHEDWQTSSFTAHGGGVAALSWAPAISPATLATGPAVARAAKRQCSRRFVTAGALDGVLTEWRFDDKSGWSKQRDLPAESCHSGALRDVAWRPHAGLPSSCIASCSEDGTIAIWLQDVEGEDWRIQASWAVPGEARRLAWSKAGTLLSVAVGDAGSLLYKEAADGKWLEVGPLA